MRPIRLKVSAFGPYAGEEILDFGALGENTLFLICGPTGAGKSTILDAMCYALYGKTSGGMRSGVSLRSDYAGADTLTEVAFDFAIGEKRYRITRIPEQMRRKKRSKDPNATALQKMESALYEIDEDGEEIRLITAKNTEKEATDLLGVDVEQFRQIILLPQGDFRRLLLAESPDRQRIMQSLFHTDVYSMIENKLYARMSAVAKVHNSEKVRIETLYHTAGAATADELAEKISKAEEEGRTAAEAYQKEEARQKEFLKAYDEAQALLGAWERLRKAQTKGAELAERKKDMDALDVEIQRIAAAARLKDARAQLEDTLERGRARSEEAKAAQARLVETEKSLAQAKAEMAAVEKEEEAQKAKEIRIVQLRQMEGPAAQYGKAQAEAARLDGIWKKAARALDAAADSYQKAKAAAEDARTAAYCLEAVFMETQAAYLAQHLEEGTPCPVCGATHHPAKAHSDKPIPDKKDVDSAKDRAKRADEAEKKALALYQNGQKQEADSQRDLAAAKAFLSQLEQTVEPEYRNTEVLARTIRKLASERDAYEARKKRAETALQSLSEKKKQEETARDFLQSEVEKLRAQYKEDKAQLLQRAEAEGFLTLEEMERYFLEISQEGAKRKTLAEYRAAVVSAHDMAAEAEKAIAGRTEPDRRQWERDRADRDSQVKAALTAKTQWDSKTRGLREVADEIKTVEAQHKETDARYKLVGRLYDLFHGQSNGINLERFVLGALLDDVTRKANLRLKVMSGGRYELFRKKDGRDDARKKGGLDLVVFDGYTGKERPANTLSGGETFLASLSLALGLADVVQEYAGGIHLDAMFIDEGFGTLDSESLDLALKTLTKLQSQTRLVGIISHVAELEERIPAKLRVTKTECGSKAEFEVN